jgi:hypothetical protein
MLNLNTALEAPLIVNSLKQGNQKCDSRAECPQPARQTHHFFGDLRSKTSNVISDCRAILNRSLDVRLDWRPDCLVISLISKSTNSIERSSPRSSLPRSSLGMGEV